MAMKTIFRVFLPYVAEQSIQLARKRFDIDWFFDIYLYQTDDLPRLLRGVEKLNACRQLTEAASNTLDNKTKLWRALIGDVEEGRKLE